MNFLRQSTAVDIAIGPFIDDDGITPATGLSITQAEVRVKKNNAAWAQCSDNTTATHEEEGWYEKEFGSGDTDTCGILIVAVYISGNLAYWKEFQVVEEAVYDMFFAASATGIIGTAQTGDSFARLGAPAGASVSADVAAVKGDTTAILVDTGTTLDARIPAALVNGRMDCTIDGTGMEAGAVTAVQSGLATAAELAKVPKSDGTATWNATALASINAEADAALADYDPPTRTEATADKDEILTAVGDVPTSSELSTALAAADDAVLAAIAALNNISVANILAATVEGSTTLVQTLRLLNAALGGKASGLETTTAVYRDIGDTKDRITATVDADGNRSAVTLDLT